MPSHNILKVAVLIGLAFASLMFLSGLDKKLTLFVETTATTTTTTTGQRVMWRTSTTTNSSSITISSSDNNTSPRSFGWWEWTRSTAMSSLGFFAGTKLNESVVAVEDGRRPPPDSTIIVTTNLIPSSPRIRMINETIHSLYDHAIGLHPKTPLIITVDSLKPQFASNTSAIERFEQYMNNLRAEFNDTHQTVLTLPKHIPSGLTWIVYNAMQQVQTKFVYVIQHDMPFLRDIHHTNMTLTMEQYPQDLKFVRFNLRRNEPVASNEGACFDMPTPVRNNVNGMQFTKSKGWSDNNHFTTKAYYDNLFETFLVPSVRGIPMEWIMMNISFNHCVEWGPHLYGGVGDEPVIGHLDGRFTQNYRRTRRRERL